MPQHHNLSFQPSPRLERRDQDMQEDARRDTQNRLSEVDFLTARLTSGGVVSIPGAAPRL
jgi:hypothetical protein